MRIPACVAVLALAPAAASADEGRGPTDAPASPLSFTLEATSEGDWRMALENTGDAPLRVLSDARLVWLEVVTAPVPPDEGSKKKPKPKAYPKGKIPICRAPRELLPSFLGSDRWVVLKKGERVVEHFDPVLLCGASATADGLGRGAIVYPHFGTPPSAAMKRARKPAPPAPPFAIEPASAAATGPFLRDVEAPALAIGYELSAFSPESIAAGGGPGKPFEDADERAPRLQVTAPARGDASGPNDIAIYVAAKNVGMRAMTVHLRPDDFAFTISPPYGAAADCSPGAASRGAARDFFAPLGKGRSRSFTLWLRERCAGRTFDRPGVYAVSPRLVLRETGEEYGLTAFTAEVPASNPTRIRVRTGRLPFHVTPPLVRKQGEPDEPAPPEAPPPATPAEGEKKETPDSGKSR